ncbi:MAG TPA: hypothetical protein VM694_35165 [Polyangium sp.]|nr:hypothetical protein [Polyangium sp.]
MRTAILAIPLSLGLFAVLAASCGGGDGSAGSSGTTPPPDTPVTVLDPTCGVEVTVSKTPTYAEDVAPILMKNCATCHTNGGIAPFPLLDYEQTKPLAALLAERTTAREMPPFNPNNCGHCNTFQDARWLTSEEIATISAWAEAGGPAGDLAKAPAPPAPPTGLADANLTIDMGVSYTPDGSTVDDYRCFIVDPGITADTFLTAYEVLPGDPRVVHHVIAFALDTAAAEAEAESLDAAEAGPGYTCFGGPGVGASRFVVGWAPGGGPTRFPAGTGLRLEGGRKMVVQVHYNLASGALPDQTRIAAVVQDSVEKEATISRISAQGINLPPQQPMTTVTNDETVPAGAGSVTLWGVAPHMHGTGKTMHVEAEHDGQKQCLLDVGNWDFHWQSFSMYETPPKVQGGDTIRITCGYDTTGRDTVTKQGEGTEDEMCIAFFYVTQ